jgi:hypothetical protein
VDPLARPYYETESQQLIGVVGGVPGAAEYEILRSDQGHPTGATAARLESQFAGQTLLILILLVGIGGYLGRRWTRRER